MHDPQYRLAIAWQNAAYNQPPHPGFYLGEGMAAAPRPNIQLVNNITTPVRDVSVTDLAVDVFPNPSVKSFIIKLNSSFTFQVFDTNGRMILQGNGSGTTEIGQQLQPGVYFLKIQSKKKSSTQKIIKQ